MITGMLYLNDFLKILKYGPEEPMNFCEAKATYSNKGGLTSVTVFQEANKTSTILYGYDSFGNIISLTKQDLLGENGGSYNMKINYDNELQTYPVNINDSYSESSSTIYDYLFGVPVELPIKQGIKCVRIDNRGRVMKLLRQMSMVAVIVLAGPYVWNIKEKIL